MLKFFLLVLLFSPVLALSNPVFTIVDPGKIHVPGRYIQLLPDKDEKLTIDEAMQHKGYSPASEDIPNLGVSACYWIKLEVQNKTSIQNFQLVIPYPTIDRVDFFLSTMMVIFMKIIPETIVGSPKEK